MTLPEPTRGEAWHVRTAEDALAHFGSTTAGLSAQEAAARLAANGPNVLQDTTTVGPWRILFAQFSSLIVWVLIIAGLVAFSVGETIDAAAIFVIVLLNAAIGFYQEYNAERSITALKQMTAPSANVMRDGKVTSVPASDIVEGDVLLLAAGDMIAADARLLTTATLSSIEAALTGESDAVDKRSEPLPSADVALGDRANMVFMGTGVATGTGQAVVVATAMRTELGRIAGLLESAGGEQKTPLQVRLDAIGRTLLFVALGIVLLLFVFGVLRGTPLLEMFMTSVSLAVAAVPEGLPAVVTVALSLGVMRMAKRRALVRRLSAVETLGSTNVICTDKTGTLTVGEMTVRAFHVDGQRYDLTGEGYEPKGDVLVDGKKIDVADPAHATRLKTLTTILLGCNDASLEQREGDWRTIGDPTEGALLVAGAKAGGDKQKLEQEMPRVHALPFDSDRKRSSVIRRETNGSHVLLANGAPGPLLERCTQLFTNAGVRALTDDDRKQISEQTSAMARQSMRVLAAARRDLGSAMPGDLSVEALERDLVFVGLSGMYDPPRAEAKAAVGTCQEAGIRVVMITGDHPETGSAIARELGITTSDDAAVTGVELEAMPDETLKQRVDSIAVYARVSAEHKLRIVRAWKANHAVVAMTGDGVNDAPAIKGADIGVAMGTAGTEVTKQAADIIITDDNFATIVSAVEEGRGIYDNIRKTLQYLLAGNVGELLLMLTCVVIGLPTPLLPIHLLWINLVTDGLPALCLAVDPIDPAVMKQKPRDSRESITDRDFVGMLALSGFLSATLAFTVYVVVLQTQPAEVARSWAFTVLVFEELLRAFSARSATQAVWRMSPFSNPGLVAVVLVSIGLQVLSQQNDAFGRFLQVVPMSLADSAKLLALAAIPLCLLEIVKAVRRRRASRHIP